MEELVCNTQFPALRLTTLVAAEARGRILAPLQEREVWAEAVMVEQPLAQPG